ncbi:uncharacterized protein LOC111329635 [Stylophora pistillata]|uniref:Uncharacterized protein n=1 Tax=Stylophora pistillata TaxID=50429 RepID=A0A2B4SA26_STYPI|nr:uncharacterized protein LOC111329635 [Stylophora pistillata]PFX25959.1 hypothetical protein AWC38_SpisGene9376 [Stylophora pistillata]
MATVQSLGYTTGAKTFGEWSTNFTAFVVSHFSGKCTRVDVVFDRYNPNSIKEVTRAKRKKGKNKGITRNAESREQRIGNWDRESLQELSSDHEEADTRIVLDARDATDRGYQQVNILCRDTDVLVLLLAFRKDLCKEILMFSGTSRRKKYIPVHNILLPEEKRKSLLAFHAIKGCDNSSQFAGIGKQSAWKILEGTPELIEHLGEHCPPLESVLADSEAFVRQLYNHVTNGKDINKDRASAFRKVKKNLDSFPPTKDALHLHIRRANYQSMIWNKAKEPHLSLASPEENGWFYKEGVLKPKLTNQEELSASCLQLAFCGCSCNDSTMIVVSTADVLVFGCLLDVPKVASVDTRVETLETIHLTKKKCD